MSNILNGSTRGLNRVFVRNATTLAGLTGAASTLGSNSLISKNCGSNSAVGGTFTELDATNDPGAYYYTPTSGETGTNGDLHMTAKGTNAATASIFLGFVGAVDVTDGVRMGLTALPNANAAASGGLPTIGSGAGQINVDGAGNVPVTAASVASGVWGATAASFTASGSFGEQVGQPASTVGSGTNGATTFSTNLGTPAVNKLINQWLFFLSGTLAGQSQQIASNDASGNITMSHPFTGAPVSTDRFITIGK